MLNKYKYKIFGRSKGRKKNNLFNLQHVTNYEFNFNNKIQLKDYTILDIGSGSGENSIYLSKMYPNSKIIACDIFKDGNINLCNYVFKNSISNNKYFHGNVLEFFDKTKSNNFIDEIWILFPDPWPKSRHHKRRLINTSFLELSTKYLKDNGKLMISTDCQSYIYSILNTIYNLKDIYEWKNQRVEQWTYQNLLLPKTKFYKKALKNKRKSIFFELLKI